MQWLEIEEAYRKRYRKGKNPGQVRNVGTTSKKNRHRLDS